MRQMPLQSQILTSGVDLVMTCYLEILLTVSVTFMSMSAESICDTLSGICSVTKVSKTETGLSKLCSNSFQPFTNGRDLFSIKFR